MSISDTINSLNSLGSSITSPAKLGFAGYILLAYTGKITTSRYQFFVVTGIFFLFQVVHDDYIRKVLNRWADYGLFKFPKDRETR
jgi:hypothetical protein